MTSIVELDGAQFLPKISCGDFVLWTSLLFALEENSKNSTNLIFADFSYYRKVASTNASRL